MIGTKIGASVISMGISEVPPDCETAEGAKGALKEYAENWPPMVTKLP